MEGRGGVGSKGGEESGLAGREAVGGGRRRRLLLLLAGIAAAACTCNIQLCSDANAVVLDGTRFFIRLWLRILDK